MRIGGARGPPGDLLRIRRASEALGSIMGEAERDRLARLSGEELQDLARLVGIAGFLLAKYEDKREVRDILAGFARMAEDAAESVEGIDDEIASLVLSAEDAIARVRGVHWNVPRAGGGGGINLTNASTGLDTPQYQHTPRPYRRVGDTHEPGTART